MKNVDFFTYSFILGASIFLAEGMYFNQKKIDNFQRNIVVETDLEFAQHLADVKQFYRCSYDKQCKTMAEAIYFEGRGEKAKGQIAIGQVVKRRSEKTSKTIRQVVYQKNSEGVCQFSYVCDIEKKRIANKITDKKSWNQAIKYADGVILNKYPDYSKGADHYFNPRKVKEQPYWAKKMIQVSSIDNHVFYFSGTKKI